MAARREPWSPALPSNHFLDTLPPAAFEQLRPHLEPVRLEQDDVIAEPGRRLSHAWLPLSCVLSVVAVMEDGRVVESRTIGVEGGFGLLHALGSRVAYERVLAQVGGEVYRIDLRALAAAAASRPDVTQAIVRHAQASLVQSAQFTACNVLHRAPERLCRWLLMTADRIGADVVPLTQEHLAIMLGVQRTTVSALVSELKDDGVITYARGRIRILDRPALRRRACECYGILTESVREILGDRD